MVLLMCQNFCILMDSIELRLLVLADTSTGYCKVLVQSSCGCGLKDAVVDCRPGRTEAAGHSCLSTLRCTAVGGTDSGQLCCQSCWDHQAHAGEGGQAALPRPQDCPCPDLRCSPCQRLMQRPTGQAHGPHKGLPCGELPCASLRHVKPCMC